MGKKITRKGIKYEVSDGEVIVAGLKDKEVLHLDIPDEIDGMPVKWIYAHAFMNENFVTASLPAGITKIPNATFYKCRALQEIQFRGEGENAVEIMQCGIGYCSSLTTIKSKRPVKKIYGEISIQHCDNLAHIENLT